VKATARPSRGWSPAAEVDVPDLDDLVTVSDLAAEFGFGRAAIGNWPRRYPDFPAPLTSVSCGHVAIYSLRQVRAWADGRRWPDPARKHNPGPPLTP